MSKTLNTKIQLRYDTWDNWSKNSSVVLLSGEIGIVAIPQTVTETGLAATPPLTMIKVGDGQTTFGNLPWLSATAADVYSWAKASTKPTYTYSEVGAAPSIHHHDSYDSANECLEISGVINN